jgi:peptide deformylase
VTERQIRLFGDPVLKTPSDPIGEIDDGVRGLVEDLVDSVLPPGRAGVAAPQIGVNERAFSYNVDGKVGYVINPVLVEVSGEPELMDEGCLSVPGLWFKTLRYPYASTATRSRSPAPVCSRRRCSTRPTTSTASSTSTGWTRRAAARR